MGDEKEIQSTSRTVGFSDGPPKQMADIYYSKKAAKKWTSKAKENSNGGKSSEGKTKPSEMVNQSRPQTSRDRERLDAGRQALRALLKERKLKKSKSTSCAAVLRLYITILAALLIIGGLMVLLFLVPMTIDPALATLNYDIDYEPAICLTLYSTRVKKAEEKLWCSCSEGCTRDVFFCDQITVAYRKKFLSLDQSLHGNFNKTAYYSKIGMKIPSIVDEIDESKLSEPVNSDCRKVNWIYDSKCWDVLNASLLVNVKGCGYPPEVECDDFLESYNRSGRRFLCYYSRLDPYIVLSYYDPSKPWDEIIQSLGWTCGAQAVGVAVIFLLHCPFLAAFKSLFKKKPKPDRWDQNTTTPTTHPSGS